MAIFETQNQTPSDKDAFGYTAASNLGYEIDNAAVAATGKSVFDSVSDVFDKAVPIITRSIINSFAHTANDIGNWITGSKDQYDTLEVELSKADSSGQLLQYYQDRQSVLDVGALAIGSLLPGTIALKALKAVQAGNIAYISRATNILAGPRKSLLDAGIAEIEAGTASLYGGIAANKYKAIALGFGEQALQAAAWETATLATMYTNPTLEKGSVGDIVSHIATGAVLGGVIGGAFDAIGIHRQFKQALLGKEVTDKFSELSTRFGKTDLGQGDRAIELIESVFAIPVDKLAAVGESARVKFNTNKQSAITDAKLMLQKLGPENDPEVTNVVFDALLRAREAGVTTKEDMYLYLGRAAKMQRLNETQLIPDAEYFYVNQYKNPSYAQSLADITSPAPTVKPDLQRRYRYTYPGADKDLTVSRFDDAVTWEGKSVRKYADENEAFNKGGVDVFLDSKMIAHVNPGSSRLTRAPLADHNRILTAAEEKALLETGQLPVGKDSLLGASIVFNVRTGAIRESAIPVVGDLASGKNIRLEANGKGLQVGDRFYEQHVQSGFSAETIDAVEANSRYVWADLRGVKDGDAIQLSDIPMMEALLKNWDKVDHSAIKLINAEGEVISTPGKIEVFQRMLLQEKAALIEALSRSYKVTNDPFRRTNDALEAAQKANVSSKWIENGMDTANSSTRQEAIEAGALIPASEHMTINNVRISYDIARASELDGNVVRGSLDTEYRISIAKQQATAAVANFFGESYEKYILRGTSADANQLGASPGFLSFINADAKTLAASAQFTGQQATLHTQARQQLAQDKLLSGYNAVLSNEAAGAELGTLTYIGRRSPERYVFLPDEIGAKHKLPVNTIVLEHSLVKNTEGIITDWKPEFAPKGYKPGDELRTYYSIQHPETAAFLRANQSVNDERLLHHNNWMAAIGLYKEITPGALYFPPIDTNVHKFVAFVRDKSGKGGVDSSVAAIAADSAEKLQQKVANLGEGFEVFYKNDLKKNHQVIGDYDYNMNLVQNSVDDTLRRRGILSDVTPTVRGENVLKEFVDWNMRQETRLVRNHVELANSQLFAELRAQGERFTASETSKTGYVAAAFASSTPNPFNSYINTSLGISEKSTYRLWQDANEKVEQYFSTAFKVARESFGAASKGLIKYEDAVKLSESYGLGNPYEKTANALTAYGLANQLPPQRYLQAAVSQAHAIISATAIRLDAFQNIINIVSTPVMLLSQAAAVNSRYTAELAAKTTVEVPGLGGKTIPSSMKAAFDAVSNFFDPTHRAAYEKIYKDYGWIRDRSSDYIGMLNDVSVLSKGGTASELHKGMAAATEKASRLIGSNWSEEFVRFIAADTGRQLYEAQGMVGYELWSSVNTFVNRVHGNYIASQRPVAFQGPLGQAISLFQTYQFNLMQQVFKHIENGEGKSLAILGGLQATLFGMQGLPGFQAVNTHIVGNAAGNNTHADFYSGMPQLVDKKMGDWLLYGSVSNFLGAGVYTRGDINPRQITVLPINPLDVPAISSSIRFIDNIYNTASKVKDGGALLTSLLNGLEHNGISRPLTGIAQQLQGYSTTGEGKLIAAANDWASISAASRIMGARPIDEAITMDAMFRMTAYKAKDTARITQLGEAVKTHLYKNESPPPGTTEEFSAKYAASGGRIENFGRKMVEWTKDSNVSSANRVYENLKNPLNYNMMRIMGGEKLPDFSGASTQGAKPDLE